MKNNEKTETTEILAIDRYGDCFQDSSNKSKRSKGGPAGFVEIFEVDENSKKQLVGKSNLVVYGGREWLLSKAFDIQNVNITPDKDEFICWFGIGTGGCPGGDPFDPAPPTNIDSGLLIDCGISQIDASCADLRIDGWYYKHPLDSIEFTEDPDNDSRWLLMTITTTMSTSDANGFQINEAGLFTALSNVSGYAGPFNLFARISYPTVVKTVNRQLVFVWYIYF